MTSGRYAWSHSGAKFWELVDADHRAPLAPYLHVDLESSTRPCRAFPTTTISEFNVAFPGADGLELPSVITALPWWARWSNELALSHDAGRTAVGR